MRVIQSKEKLFSEALHDRIGHLAFRKQCAKTCKTLPHGFQNDTSMAAIRSNMFK